MTIRKSLILPIALLIVALSVISVTTLFAKEDGATTSAVTPFASKVANIIGMDEITVAQAIKQAQSELRTERISKKLRQMVEEGELTQEEANEKLAGLTSGARAKDGPSDKMRYAKADHAWGKGLQKKGRGNREGVTEIISQMVDNGILAQDDADRKLEALGLA